MGFTGMRASAVGVVLALALVGALGCSNRPMGTVEGHVTMGPMCPVEREDVPCPDAPMKGVEVTASGRGGVVRGQTDDTGAYRLTVPAPGSFAITVHTRTTPPTCPTSTVTVTPDETVTKDIGCDSGIR